MSYSCVVFVMNCVLTADLAQNMYSPGVSTPVLRNDKVAEQVITRTPCIVHFVAKASMKFAQPIAGPTVFICDERVELCMDIIRGEQGVTRQIASVPTPNEILLPITAVIVSPTPSVCRLSPQLPALEPCR